MLCPVSKSFKLPNHFLDGFCSNQFPFWCKSINLQWGCAWENEHNVVYRDLIAMSKSSDVSLNYSFKKRHYKDKRRLLEPVWLPRANALPSWIEKPVSICLAVFSVVPVSKNTLGSDSMFDKPVNTTEHWGFQRLLMFHRGWSFVPINQGLCTSHPLFTPINTRKPQVLFKNLLTSWARSLNFFNTKDPFQYSSPMDTIFQKTLPCAYYNEQNCVLFSDSETPKMIYKPHYYLSPEIPVWKVIRL